MKKLTSITPGRLEEIAVITFFILFFILTIVAESSAQVNGNSGHYRMFNRTSSGHKIFEKVIKL